MSNRKVEVKGYKAYMCRQGDSFDLLAAQAYGTETMAHVIAQENPDYIDVLLFDGGETIRLPLVETVETPDTLPPWRR